MTLDFDNVQKFNQTQIKQVQPQEIMHQSFVTTAPPPSYGEGWVIAGLKCGAITFQVSPQCRRNDEVLRLGSLPQGDFLLRMAGQRAKF